jgi:UDP-hydrolysing UDP-N-acetyl-D-glucosamine 2-epimerase
MIRPFAARKNIPGKKDYQEENISGRKENMKHICLIAGSLTEYQILKPLADALYKEPDISLTQITSDEHLAPDMLIRHFRIEEDGFTISDESCVFLKGSRQYFQGSSRFFQHRLGQFFSTLPPDIAVLTGNRSKTLQAAIAATLHHIPVAHINGGVSGYGLWDHSYGYGITKLAHLHFTAAETFRQQIIAFGENENTVFNVGSLTVERANRFYRPERKAVNTQLGLDPDDRYILVDLHPDEQIGSENEQMLKKVLSDLESRGHDDRKLAINLPQHSGIGKMMEGVCLEFEKNHPGRARACRLSDLSDLANAIACCDLVISNHPETLMLAASEKKPAIFIRPHGSNSIRPGNQIDVDAGSSSMIQEIENALLPDFADELGLMISPFEQSHTARKIKEKLCNFDSGQIRHKDYYLQTSAPEPGLFDERHGNII